MKTIDHVILMLWLLFLAGAVCYRIGKSYWWRWRAFHEPLTAAFMAIHFSIWGATVAFFTRQIWATLCR